MKKTFSQKRLQRLIQAMILLLCTPVVSSGQVKLGNNTIKRDSSAALEIESDKQVLLLPRIDDTSTIVSTVKDGSLIYFNNPAIPVAQGLYLRSDAKWNWLLHRSTAWSAIGNSGLNSNANFLGTIDAGRLVFKTANTTRMTIDSNGYVGLGTGLPKATLHNQGSTVLGAKSIPGFTNNGSLGTAAATVDAFSVFIIPQATPALYITIPDPTIRTAGRIIYIVNTGNADIAGPFRVVAGQASILLWNGSVWKQVADQMYTSFPVNVTYTTTNDTRLGIGTNAATNAGANNLGLGNNSLTNLSSGSGNVGIFASTVGGNTYSNVIISPNMSNTGTEYRVAIGNQALNNNSGTFNIAIGDYSLNRTSGDVNVVNNVAIGHRTLNMNAISAYGGANTAVGYLAAGLWDVNMVNAAGMNILAFGRGAALNRSGNYISAFGANALSNAPASALVQTESGALGFSAFSTDSSVSTNNGTNPVTKSLAIGAFAQVTGSNAAIVLGSARTGYQSNVGIGTYNPQYKVHVNGTVYCSAITTTSDRRLKKDIFPVGDVLQKIKAITGVSYRWEPGIAAKLNVYADSLPHLGFIAQDIEKILPEVVHTAADSFQLKTVAYAEVMPVITEAIKQQQPLIDALQQKRVYLESRLRRLQQELDELEKTAATK